MKKQTVTLVSALALSSFAVSALANDIRTALAEGDADLSLRYRLEHVEVDYQNSDTGINLQNKDALASTLKTRLTYKSKAFYDTQLTLEFDDVHVIGDQRYADGDGRPGIADPEGTDLNQASLTYTGLTDTSVIVGKQRIVLGNQRFVGGVAWRQHEQTYNAGTIVNSSLPDTTLIYAYVDKVNHFIETADDYETDAHAFYVENKSIENHKITAYGFLIDVSEVAHGQGSTQTYGARFEGGFAGVGYALEYAEQSEYSRSGSDEVYENNPALVKNFNADYFLAEASYTFEPVKVLAGHEVLGTDLENGVSFSTPIATKHKFNGWADQFLKTPGDGLEDTYVGVSGNVSGVTLKAVYHEYESDETDTEYGNEWNLAASKKFGGVNALLKYATYKADNKDVKRADTQKVWLQVATKF